MGYFYFGVSNRFTAYFDAERLELRGVELIKHENGITNFDVALVDGGSYSGQADTKSVYGAKYLILDDIMTIKCKWVFERMVSDRLYEIIMHKPATKNHFGYAAFERKT